MVEPRQCESCGKPIQEEDQFCRGCGAPAEAAPPGPGTAEAPATQPAPAMQAAPLMPAAVAKQGIGGRTIRDFQHGGNVWDIAAAWAQQNGYLLKGTDQSGQYFQKGTGFWTAPRRVQIQWTGSYYHLEAWVHMPTFNYVMAFGILPREMVLESGGFRGVVPRNQGRREVNELLAMLGQPPIP